MGVVGWSHIGNRAIAASEQMAKIISNGLRGKINTVIERINSKKIYINFTCKSSGAIFESSSNTQYLVGFVTP